MHVRISIACDNEAFSNGNGPLEVARILKTLARSVAEDSELASRYVLRDMNGNRVGEYVVTR